MTWSPCPASSGLRVFQAAPTAPARPGWPADGRPSAQIRDDEAAAVVQRGAYLDLAVDTPSHLSAESLGFRMPAGAILSDAQKHENAVSEALVSQLLASDVVVVGALMYNFAVPTQFKAWVDRIAQAGRTFKYTGTGPVGLVTGKTVIVASTRGGAYSTSDAGNALEHRESYLKTVFGFMGMTDVRIVRAEGQAMGDAAKAAALAAAELNIMAHHAAAIEPKAALAA
jgi:FMN-dependent NADH-azoreductase